ncbi:hypothetical protein ACFL3D_00295 [Candidatus Omnitrophota bacterium]
MINIKDIIIVGMIGIVPLGMTGCTVKAVGDPNRPITINAHITVDVKGMQNTATNIEDYVSGKSEQPFKK